MGPLSFCVSLLEFNAELMWAIFSESHYLVY